MKSIVQISDTNPYRCHIDDSPSNEVSYTSTDLIETTMRDLTRCGEDINDYTPVGDNEFINKFNTIKQEMNHADK